MPAYSLGTHSFGSRLIIGSGKYIEFTAPEPGLAFVVHPSFEKVILTKSLKAGEALRWDDGSLLDERQHQIFRAPGVGDLDSKDVWRLYFTPEPEAGKKRAPPPEKEAEAGTPQPPDTIR